MNSKWVKTTIGEQATLQRGFDITRKEQKLGNVPVISSSGISSFHDTSAANGPGVVIGRKGSLGTVFYLGEDYWPHDTTLWVKDFHGNNPKYVYYFFKSLDVTHLDVGSANPTLNRNHVHPIEVLWPPLEEQNIIANILSSLDERIELHHQMNETLEATVSTFFKSWFVDFDPVRAKMKGIEPYGMDAETAALFPDSFVNYAIREIPRGWVIQPLDQIANFLNGLALQKYPPEGMDYLPVIKIAELKRGITETSDKASPNIEKKYIVEDGDVIFSWSGSLDVVIWGGGKGALNQHLFKVTSSEYPKWFFYQWIKYHLPEFQAIAAGKATTMGHIQRHHLSKALTIVPPEKILNRMDQIIAPILNLIINNEKESQTLSVARDILLPKLISGEIRVQDAEKYA